MVSSNISPKVPLSREGKTDSMQIVPFAGWQKNAKLVCNDVEMIVTLEVGPRIISYGPKGGKNMLAVHEATAGMSGQAEFHSYGGHRLWIAPEMHPRTFQPDNSPVEASEQDDWAVFTTATDAYHIQKEFRIKAEPEKDRFVVSHRLYNHGAYPVELAPWTPTQFATGGECLFPQAPFIPHSEKVLPARPLVLWHYTDMSDSRWTWGKKVVRLKWEDKGPTKVGTFVDQGYAAYVLDGNTYLRRFAAIEGANYPDGGCNFETFSRQDMLEVETLSPMQIVESGAFAEHTEVWYLIPNQIPPDNDDACADWLADLVATRPF
ncbi:hypothetical protein BH11ARM1_BH11ARM1_04210 [soil metagenome]